MGTRGDMYPLGLCIALCLWGTVAQNHGVQGTTGDCNSHMLCPANAKCVNSTHCTCLDGYQPSGNRFFTDPTEPCDELTCPLLLGDDNSAGAKGFLNILEKQINLVGQQSESVEWRHRIATELMALVEKLLRTLALTVHDRISIASPSGTELGLAVRQAGNQSQETVTLQQSKTQMDLKWAGAPGQKNEGFTLAGLLTYQGMSPILDGAGRVEAPEWDEIGRTGKWAQEPGRPSYRVLSPVVSAFISDPNPQALGLSVSIRFSHPVPVSP
ncbi:hypothetical protein KIL84_021168 [Mauremys mutica]|uniref:Uncharacterized protein n=1 Tax=Mauremys mutica TaxID=74926 RepID=A0A9D3X9L1_9SAUR|nr:hypothetical protein KIL84_021168 [Mauremys mutica]